MTELRSYRSPAARCEVEVQCPGCGRWFFVSNPDAEVSVSTCPHGECQLVSFVWAGGLRGRVCSSDRLVDCKAIALSDLVRPPPPRTSFELTSEMVFLGTFLVLPTWMCVAIWDEYPGFRLFMLILTAPALFLGVLGLLACCADLVDDLRLARRSTRKRRASLDRARWLESSERAE